MGKILNYRMCFKRINHQVNMKSRCCYFFNFCKIFFFDFPAGDQLCGILRYLFIANKRASLFITNRLCKWLTSKYPFRHTNQLFSMKCEHKKRRGDKMCPIHNERQDANKEAVMEKFGRKKKWRQQIKKIIDKMFFLLGGQLENCPALLQLDMLILNHGHTILVWTRLYYVQYCDSNVSNACCRPMKRWKSHLFSRLIECNSLFYFLTKHFLWTLLLRPGN